MKKLILSTLLMSAFSGYGYAQHADVEEDSKKLFEDMREMIACTETLEKEPIKQLLTKLNDQHEEMDSLCAAGKRQQAQEKNLYYYKSKVNDPNYSEMKKCMLLIFSNSNQVEEDPNVNICDSL